jgi:purine-binding chemotaxis protein CheW
MTPSHTGLGAVVLCTAAGLRVAVDMRHVVGTDRVEAARPDAVLLADRLGLASAAPATRLLRLASPAGRLALAVEHVSQPLDTPERIPLSPLLGPAVHAVFESTARIGDDWFLVLDVGALFGVGRAAMPEVPATGDGEAPGRLVRRRHASRGHLIVFSAGSVPAATDWLPAADAAPAGLAYALSAAQVIEVLRIPEIVPVPLAPSYVRGVCQWRGRPLVVVDLAMRLLPAPFRTTDAERLLVCRGQGRERLAVLASADVQMVRLPLRHVSSRCPLPLDPGCARAVVEVGRTTLVLPDLQRLGEPPASRA